MRKPSHNSALIALAVVLAGCTPSQSRVETAIAYTQIAIEHALPKMTETPAVTPSATPEPTLVPTPNSTLSSYAIAFDAAIDSYGDLFIMDQAGANLENLTQSTNKEWSPVWSPDGSTMAYLSRPENWRSHIEGFVMVMGAHGENMISLTHVSQLVSEMAWSPDGTTLAIVSSGTSSDYTLSTYSFNENTLTVHIEDRPVLEGLSWLPDGQSIAITSFVAGSGLSPQGTRPVTLLVIDLESGDTSRVV